MSDMVRLVHHLASGAELQFSRMRAKVHGLCGESDVSRSATAIGRGAFEDTSLWQHGSLAPISIEWLPMIIGARTFCEHSVGLHPTADLPTTCLWSSNPSLPMASAALVG
jgi:hypothetical protein